MTNLLPSANETVQAALKAKRIGTPVFARIFAHTTDDHGRIEPLLGAALEAAQSWLGDAVQQMAALGSVASGQITVLARTARGKTALVSAGTHGTSPPLLETTVIGNHGALSWEPGCGAGSQPSTSPAKQSTPADEGRRLLDAARKSLELRSAVGLDGRPTGSAPSDAPASKAPPSSKPAPLKKSAPPFGVLLIAGNHTHQENYARSLAADKRCRLIAVSDDPGVTARRRELNEALAGELKVPHLPDYREALARGDIHVISVCAEPERRADIAVRCAEAGKHLYLDKPLCASRDEAARIVAAIEKAGVVSQMFSLVRSAAPTRLRELIASGAVGKATALHMDVTFAKGFTGGATLDKARAETARPKQFETIDSKREFYNVGVYPVVQLHWLLGQRVKRVCAATGNYFFAEHQRNGMEDFGAALLELEGGGVASIAAGRTGWRSHPSSGLNRNYLVGDKGVAVIDAYRPRLEAWPDAEPWQPPRKHPLDPMGFWSSTTAEAGALPKTAWATPATQARDEFAYFLDCVEASRASDVSAQVAAQVNSVLLAVYESAAAGAFVSP
jgi:predicted dehydrogenase